MASVLNESIKYAGQLDFKKLISTMLSWFDEYNFEYHEADYIQKDKDLQIKYEAERNRNEWFKDTITVDFQFWGIKTIKGGSLDSEYVIEARLQISYSIGYETGYEDMFGDSKFRNTKFKAWLFDFLQKTGLKYDVTVKYEDSVNKLGRNLINTMKESMGMEIGLTRQEDGL